MTRGVSHPAELRAEAVAAVLAGATISDVARRYGLDKAVVSRWVATDASSQRARDVDLGALIVDLITAHFATIHAQLQAASRPDWLAQQPAAELAQLVAVERDTTLRLLAGLRPVDDQPALVDKTGPAYAPPGPAGDL